jgi:ribose transport system permease protein
MSTATAPPAPEAGPKPRTAPRLASVFDHAASRYSLFGVWAIMIVLFWAAKPDIFMTSASWQSIFNSQYSLMFMAMALLCTIIVGEFVDLSVPYVFGLSATILGILVANHHWNVWLAALVAVAAAAAVGAVQGLLVVVVGVNTIVVTLGMGTLLTGVALWMSDMNNVSFLNPGFSQIALFSIAGLPVSFWYGVIGVAVFAYVLGCTPLGRHMRFTGASREVSRLSGVRVNRIRFGSFVAAGVLSGLGAVVTLAQVGGFNANYASSYLLPVFASVFLGTAILQPGRFNPVGTWIGIFFLATGNVGLEDLGLQTWVSNVFYGGVLVIAVTISTILRRRTT